LGCSHTYGIGTKPELTWPSILGAINLGVPGCSSDMVVRILPDMLEQYNPSVVYILWPDWTRFEYLKNGQYHQSLPGDNDRIYHMATATNKWLVENFKKQRATAKNLCKDIKLVDMTLDELIPHIDHADQWPQTDDGSGHFNFVWHRWVADIFNAK
jgi:hypothetical protein